MTTTPDTTFSPRLTPADKKWLDDMIIELRLRQVRGTAIGDAAAAVEAHLAESGESAHDAFGDPVAYARSLEFPAGESARTSVSGWARFGAPIVAGLIAFWLTGDVTRALLARADVAITWGSVAALGILLLGVVGVSMTLRPLLRRRWAFALAFGLISAVVVAVEILWRAVAFHVPVATAIVTILALLAASVLIGLVNARDDDPLVDPRQARPGRTISLASAWLWVILSGAQVLLTLLPVWFARVG